MVSVELDLAGGVVCTANTVERTTLIRRGSNETRGAGGVDRTCRRGSSILYGTYSPAISPVPSCSNGPPLIHIPSSSSFVMLADASQRFPPTS